MWNGCLDTDPTGQLLSARIAKAELRALLGCAARGGHRHEIRHRLWRFYDWCAVADIPEVTALAETIAAWWPQIKAFLTLGITNAATEGTNMVVNQVERNAYGFRHKNYYRDRVRLHCTRPGRRASAKASKLPAQSCRAGCPATSKSVRPSWTLNSEQPTAKMPVSRWDRRTGFRSRKDAVAR